MKVTISESNGHSSSTWRARFVVEPDKFDIAYNNKLKGKLNLRDVDIDLVPGARLDQIHPDLLGLTALLLVAPLSKNKVELNIAVSEGFKETVSKNLIALEAPVNRAISRRAVSPAHRPGLAFSGGVDSCAALLLMPRNTVPVFLHRRRPENAIPGIYNDSAALATLDLVRKEGYDVQRIETSLEYIRKPIGNPVDWSNSAPAIVNADALSLNSISFGLIAESAFWTGGPYFSDLKTRTRYAAWAPIFEYCNTPLSFPTASLSEVLTSKICAVSGGNFKPQSCVRGEPSKPCKRCFKCFRKGLVDAALARSFPAKEILDNVQPGSEVGKKLLEVPVHHEIVVAWAVDYCRAPDNSVFTKLRDKLSVVSDYGSRLRFMDRYYSKGLEYVAPEIRAVVEENIKKYCDPMTPQDERYFEAWKAEQLNNAGSYVAAQNELQRFLQPENV